MQIKQKGLSGIKNLTYFFVGTLVFGLVSCGSSSTDSKEPKEDKGTVAEEVETAAAEPVANKGIGPIESLELVEIDSAMASAGEDIFNAMCTACHTLDTKMIGPALAGVVGKRSPEWIMNMILNPTI
ncbi:MAG: cytochrome c [Flavobacteriales bacterium]|nr:cytochrome c [Flavobacteriales bacterium]